MGSSHSLCSWLPLLHPHLLHRVPGVIRKELQSDEAQLPHLWSRYFWLGKVTFRTSVSLISCYIRQGGPAEQKDPGHPPDVGGVSDTAQEVLSQCYFRMPLTKSQRTSAHGLSLLWWCCWDWDMHSLLAASTARHASSWKGRLWSLPHLPAKHWQQISSPRWCMATWDYGIQPADVEERVYCCLLSHHISFSAWQAHWASSTMKLFWLLCSLTYA